MVEVGLWGALRHGAGEAPCVSIDAGTIRELLRELVERYPGVKDVIDKGVAVSINGQIYRDSWDERIPEGADVYLLPRIPGG